MSIQNKTHDIYKPIELTVVSKKWTLQEIEKLRIFASDVIPVPDVVLKFGDKIIATRKNIFGVTGKAKVGKTFLMTLLNSAVLQKGVFQNTLQSFLKDGKDEIAYFDTEQSPYHVSLVMQRIYKMVGEKVVKLRMINLDAIATEERKEIIETYIYANPKIALVVIDGVADLLYGVNDEIAATKLADDLRRWATQCDVAIGYVLHQNPSDNDKMRGHLGTILMNKSETVIKISTAKDDESIKLVETTQTRNAKPDNWSFEILDGMPIIMEQVYELPSSGRPKTKVLSDIDRQTLLNEIYSKDKNGLGFSYTVLLERIKTLHIEKFGAIGDTKIKEIITYSKDMNWITQDKPKGNYIQQPWIL